MEQVIGIFTNLWTNGKIIYKVLFIILIPLALIVFGINLFLKSNVEGAKEDIKDAEKTDAEIKVAQAKTKTEADILKKEADEIEKKIQENKVKPKEDVDWYKRQ